MTLRLDDVKEAYRKLKNYVYHENVNLLLRQQLADFEDEDIDRKLEDLFKALKREKKHYGVSPDHSLTAYFEDLIDNIGYWKFIKKFKSERDNENNGVIKNYSDDDGMTTEKFVYFINAPVELQIISVLWILKAGIYLQNETKKSNFAYQIKWDDDQEKIASNINLFDPYYIGYKKWRDGALASVDQLISRKKDALLVLLDIKEYFHSVRFSFKHSSIKSLTTFKESQKHWRFLTFILENICLKYSWLVTRIL